MSTRHGAGSGRRVRRIVLAAATAGLAVAGAGTSFASGDDDVLSDNLSDNLICGQAVSVSVGSSGDTTGDCPDDDDDHKY
jgi:hypothetical protein